MLLSHIIPLTINIILTAFELDYPCSLHGLCKPSHSSFNVDLASYVTLLIVLHKQIMDEAMHQHSHDRGSSHNLFNNFTIQRTKVLFFCHITISTLDFTYIEEK
jgi:hypothetical protein